LYDSDSEIGESGKARDSILAIHSLFVSDSGVICEMNRGDLGITLWIPQYLAIQSRVLTYGKAKVY